MEKNLNYPPPNTEADINGLKQKVWNSETTNANKFKHSSKTE